MNWGWNKKSHQEDKVEMKGILRKAVKSTVESIYQKIKPDLQLLIGMLSPKYKGARWGYFISFCASFFAILYISFYQNVIMIPGVAFVVTMVLLIPAATIVYFLERLLLFIVRYPISFLGYLALLSYMWTKGAYSSVTKIVRTENIIVACIFSFILLVFARTIEYIIRKKGKAKKSLVLVFAELVLVSGMCFLLFGEGFSNKEVSFEKQGADDLTITTMQEIDGITPGNYTVNTFIYGGTGMDDAEVVDLTMYAKEADGLLGWYRKSILQMDLKEAEVKGMIWYPNEVNDCPVLFIIHGNHAISETSYDGYAYLGEYLASYGYMVVSVDENILNTLSSENDARAVLLLENMEFIEECIQKSEHALFQKGDFTKIALAGHSRGGEAAGISYLFNELEHYSENGMRRMNYDFSIQSIIEIAPSVDQFQPADHSVILQDVNFLLLQGAYDQDIAGFMGMTQYENVKFTRNEWYFKSSIYIENANHGQFNSKWGRYDMTFPYSMWLNVKNLMKEEEQQQIAKTMIKAFLDVTLKKDLTNQELFVDYKQYEQILPDVRYVQQYSDSADLFLCDFEEDEDLTTGSVEGVSIQAYHVGIWAEMTEEYSNLGFTKKRQNHVMKLKWTNREDPFISIAIPQTDVNGKIFTFLVANADVETTEDAYFKSLDLEMRIKDESGKQASIILSEEKGILPPIPVRLAKLQFITKEYEYKVTPQTVRISFEDFQKENEAIDLSNIVEIEIHILNRDSGMVYLDKIGIGME